MMPGLPQAPTCRVELQLTETRAFAGAGIPLRKRLR
jgi:hypothetical protein